jgi:hypothetical protein
VNTLNTSRGISGRLADAILIAYKRVLLKSAEADLEQYQSELIGRQAQIAYHQRAIARMRQELRQLGAQA